MTLDEALKLIAMSFINIIVGGNTTETEAVKMLLFNAVLEEWLDGSFEYVTKEQLEAYHEKYGPMFLRQAARVIANKTQLYGDVNDV